MSHYPKGCHIIREGVDAPIPYLYSVDAEGSGKMIADVASEMRLL